MCFCFVVGVLFLKHVFLLVVGATMINVQKGGGTPPHETHQDKDNLEVFKDPNCVSFCWEANRGKYVPGIVFMTI